MRAVRAPADTGIHVRVNVVRSRCHSLMRSAHLLLYSTVGRSISRTPAGRSAIPIVRCAQSNPADGVARLRLLLVLLRDEGPKLADKDFALERPLLALTEARVQIRHRRLHLINPSARPRGMRTIRQSAGVIGSSA